MDIQKLKEMEPLFGSWYVKEEIGEGSFGTVYRIEREEFGDVYESALKVITIPKSKSEIKAVMSDGMTKDEASDYFKSFVQDIVKEFALMDKVKGNTNIVGYLDHQVIEHKDEIGWDILIRMEFLKTVNDHFMDRTVTDHDVIKLGIDICNALEVCQKFNIIHRDIKPENIFVSNTGNFKLGDFGIARTAEKTTGASTRVGTIAYMAPEIYRGEKYDSTVDLYSLGLVLYRFMNHNRLPFLPTPPSPILYSDREESYARRMRGEEIPTPSEAGGRLAEIILKACNPDKNLRYSSPLMMRQELEAILNEEEMLSVEPSKKGALPVSGDSKNGEVADVSKDSASQSSDIPVFVPQQSEQKPNIENDESFKTVGKWGASVYQSEDKMNSVSVSADTVPKATASAKGFMQPDGYQTSVVKKASDGEAYHNSLAALNTEESASTENDFMKFAGGYANSDIGKKKKSKKPLVAGIIIVAAIAIAVFCGFYFPWKQKNDKYLAAVELYNNEHYSEACEAFRNLGDFKDSPQQVKKSIYSNAVVLYNSGKYDEAIKEFTNADDYSDAKDLIKKSKYQKAKTLFKNKKYDDASKIFSELGDYGDAKKMVEKVEKEKTYQQAMGLYNSGKYDKAIDLFKSIKAWEMMKKSKYNIAMTLYNAQNYKEAITAFKEIAGYSNAKEMVAKSCYGYGNQLVEEGEYTQAVEKFCSVYEDIGEAEIYKALLNCKKKMENEKRKKYPYKVDIFAVNNSGNSNKNMEIIKNSKEVYFHVRVTGKVGNGLRLKDKTCSSRALAWSGGEWDGKWYNGYEGWTEMYRDEICYSGLVICIVCDADTDEELAMAVVKAVEE